MSEEERIAGNHIDNASFLHGITSYGRIDNGNDEMMSVEFSYCETVEKLVAGEFKTMKLWMYRDDAIKYAQSIIRSAEMINNNHQGSRLMVMPKPESPSKK